MDGHFRAFSFVDRITQANSDGWIRGSYSIPSNVRTFPVSLVAEAVGQLAAWAAMAEVDFSHRPVAGIAGTVELLSSVSSGQVLDLEARLETVDTESVGYGGAAYVDGVPILRLGNCVGPMVPLEEFDDPQCLRERYALISTTGAVPGGFEDLPALNLEWRDTETSDVARAALKVPEDVPFFDDHFPRRPVFPGTLLMHANLELAGMMADRLNSGLWKPRTLSKVKLRSFIAPAEILDLEAKLFDRSEESLKMKVESRIAGRTVSSAQIHFFREGCS